MSRWPASSRRRRTPDDVIAILEDSRPGMLERLRALCDARGVLFEEVAAQEDDPTALDLAATRAGIPIEVLTARRRRALARELRATCWELLSRQALMSLSEIADVFGRDPRTVASYVRAHGAISALAEEES